MHVTRLRRGRPRGEKFSDFSPQRRTARSGFVYGDGERGETTPTCLRVSSGEKVKTTKRPVSRKKPVRFLRKIERRTVLSAGALDF